MISVRLHNILDYVIGIALVMTPYVFGFAGVPFARDAFVVLGGALIGYSLLTDYRYSLAKVIPLSVHMTFDLVSGAYIMLAPSIYGYRNDLSGFQYALHFIFGLGAIALVAFTRRGAEPPVLKVSEEEEAAPVERAA